MYLPGAVENIVKFAVSFLLFLLCYFLINLNALKYLCCPVFGAFFLLFVLLNVIRINNTYTIKSCRLRLFNICFNAWQLSFNAF